MSDDYETVAYRRAAAERARLIEETQELRRRLGLKPWQFEAWPDYANPAAPGTAEHEAFEAVRARGVELDTRLAELAAVMSSERKKQLAVRLKEAGYD